MSPRRGREMGAQLVGRTVRTHTTFMEFAVLHGNGSLSPKPITIVTTKITGHRSL